MLRFLLVPPRLSRRTHSVRPRPRRACGNSSLKTSAPAWCPVRHNCRLGCPRRCCRITVREFRGALFARRLGAGATGRARELRRHALRHSWPAAAPTNQIFVVFSFALAPLFLGGTTSVFWRPATAAFRTQTGFAATAPRCFPTELTFGTRATTVCGGWGRSVRVPLRMGYIWCDVLEPGPIKLPLSPARYTNSTGDVRGSWCLQVHLARAFARGVQRRVYLEAQP